jgi:hypothetical protein
MCTLEKAPNAAGTLGAVWVEGDLVTLSGNDLVCLTCTRGYRYS